MSDELGVSLRGYKGKGMCKHCAYSQPSPVDPKKLLCSWYVSMCKAVSRNCPGIPLVKNKNMNNEY